MKIFIVHSGSDKERVLNLQKKIYEKTKADLLMLSGTQTDSKDEAWKKEAKEKIKEANVIIYILGEKSHASKNIDFELSVAINKKKQILLLRLNQDANDKINAVLFKEDKYMTSNAHTSNKCLFKEVSLDDLTKFIQYGYGFDISYKLDDTHDPKRKEDIIEQYKVYLETSEQVLNRRQSTSNFYTTLNTSILGVGTTVSGILLGLEIINNSIMITSMIFLIIGLLGFMLCFNWLCLLESYGKLNSSKITVISEIEKRLPVNIYDTEWKVMGEKLGERKYVSFTKLEKRIPCIFMIIYGIILLLCTTGIIASLLM